MRSRRLILGLILLTLLATCLAAAAKLRATPKYDRIQVGMAGEDAARLFGQGRIRFMGPYLGPWQFDETYECDEGTVVVCFVVYEDSDYRTYKVTSKSITRRGPLERLAWLAGWR